MKEEVRLIEGFEKAGYRYMKLLVGHHIRFIRYYLSTGEHKQIDHQTFAHAKQVASKDWSPFDAVLAGPVESKRNVKDEIKARILGESAMTDSQHRYIIALFTNELNWTADRAFRFAVKVIPVLKTRLSKGAMMQTDIQALYKALKKQDASKLINILKSIISRHDKARSN